MNHQQQTQPKEWIVQRCVNAYKNQYEDWTGYCEHLMTRDEVDVALKECCDKWPDDEFRGHRVIIDGVLRFGNNETENQIKSLN